jgi:hypothetical protein
MFNRLLILRSIRELWQAFSLQWQCTKGDVPADERNSWLLLSQWILFPLINFRTNGKESDGKGSGSPIVYRPPFTLGPPLTFSSHWRKIASLFTDISSNASPVAVWQFSWRDKSLGLR